MSKTAFHLSTDLENAAARLAKAAEGELAASAKAHGIKIQSDKVIYASLPSGMIVHAPLAGIEKYNDRDFASGAAIQLVIVNSNAKGALPNGAYVVKAKHQPGASSGKAAFIDSTGAVVAEHDLIIRSKAQLADIFSTVFSGSGSNEIPNITSTHIFTPRHQYVDCSGWQPYRTLFYEVG
jgi:hypothetical protein